MLFAFAFGIDENVIKVYYHEYVELFYQDLIDVALERNWYVSQSKKHYLVLEMAIVSPKSHFPFIVFLDLHLMVDIGQIELDKTSSPT